MFIAVDVGTSSIKIVLSDSEGGVLKSFREEIPLYTPEYGAAEHNPDEILKLVIKGIRSVVKGFESRIEAIVFSTYLHGLGVLAWDSTPALNIMIHLDSRAGRVQNLLEQFGAELYRRTGCPPLFIYPLAKLLWLQQINRLSSRGCTLSFLKDYLIYKLTSHRFFAVDYGVASGTALFNIHSLKWDDYALSIAGIDEAKLPETVEGAKILDYVTLPEIGIRDRVAIVPGSFDGALQNIGYSIYGGEAALNLGSTAVIRVLSKDVILDRGRGMRFFCYYAADGYRVIGAASNNGMTALEWFRRVFMDGADWAVVGELVGRAGVCSDGVIVLPFIAGERFPYRSPHLSFTVTGLNLVHRKEHVVRASFEGVAFVLEAIRRALEENGLLFTKAHCAGGGCSITHLVEIVSEVLCKPIVVYSNVIANSASSLGGVAVAMKALGYKSGISDIVFESVMRARARILEPSSKQCREYERCFSRFEKLVESITRVIPLMVTGVEGAFN